MNSIITPLIIMLQDSYFGIIDSWNQLKNLFKKNEQKPSLIAYNVVWFTNCSWLEQLMAFKQLYYYLDYRKIQ